MSYTTAYERWSGVGPYYAMFPVRFVDTVVETYTLPGQQIFDPFAGRCSSIFAGAARGRPSIGIEINPVGWIYGQTKIAPASSEAITNRIQELVALARETEVDDNSELATFFEHCFAETTRRFLKVCREQLDWRNNDVDRTLMALILVDLHGRRDRSFSNQMSQSKAMSPEYSIGWWQRKSLRPPERDIATFLANKIGWRYAKGVANVARSTVLLGNSETLTGDIHNHMSPTVGGRIHLLLTSPPYIAITDYHRDQWLRLWMLGIMSSARRLGGGYKGAFDGPIAYRTLLERVFTQAAERMSPAGTVYVRTDARKKTFEITHDVLQAAFPNWRMRIVDQPAPKRSQTARFGDKTQKPGEKDIILSGPQT